MKKVIFIKNAVVLTVTALLLRLAGIVFRVWLAARIGSEGIGLYQLVVSVYVFVAAFAGGGICTAVTRLCAEKLADGTDGGAVSVLKKGIFLSLIIAAFSACVVFFGADFTAKHIIFDERAIYALRILGFGLPFMAVGSCVRGYFIARRKTVSSGLSQMLEQALRILIVVLLAGGFAEKGIAFACAAVVFGDTVAEGFSCLYIFIAYRIDKKRLDLSKKGENRGVFRKIIRIALPITSGRYLNSGLRTAENIIIPKNLAAFGGTNNALSQFGMIKGMALPLIFFPSSFLNSVSTLLIPELSEAAAKGEKYKIKYAADRAITLTLVSSFLISALFFTLSDRLGLIFYKSTEVGFLLKFLAPVIPLMYADSVCDGMLKGLDKQSFVFRVAVSDSLLRLLAIPLVVPRYGIKGFLVIMIVSNVYTAALRIFKLLKTAELSLDISRRIIKPALSAAVSVFIAKSLLSSLSFGNITQTVCVSVTATGLFMGFCVLFGCVSTDDFRELI